MVMVTKSEAKIEELVYRSYLEAKPYFPADTSDRARRSPDLLLPPLSRFPARQNIVITASKGKGSIARMTAALLSQIGKTGLFISPHIERLTERISVDGKEVAAKKLKAYVKEIVEETTPITGRLNKGQYLSPIGILALAGMRYFAEQETVFNVLECGRGAKYDDVNRIPHEIAIIGNIFLEHPKELGATLEEIAENKAGVITEETRTVYCLDQSPTITAIIKRRADNMGAQVKCLGRDFSEITEPLSMPGSYQKKQAGLALAVCADICKKRGIDRIDPSPLFTVRIPGRMEVLSEEPFFLLDACIHRRSAEEVAAFLLERNIRRVTLILCLPDDKDLLGVAMVMREMAQSIYITITDHPHYPMEKDQVAYLRENGMDGTKIPVVSDAIQAAIGQGLPVVFLCANTFTAAIRRQFKRLL